jgi:hypothetical protein
VEVQQVSFHSRPHRVPKTNLGDNVCLAAAALALSLGAAACAGPQAYVPFEQKTMVSAQSRWQALESVAQREQWNVVQADPKGFTLVAYSNPAGMAGIRDRIKVGVFSDRTVVETRTEVEDQGLWQNSATRCAHYSFSRERALAAQIESSQSTGVSPALPQKTPELAAR